MGATELPLTSFEMGRLKLLAHLREELDRAGIEAVSIQCKCGDILTPRDTARFIVTTIGRAAHVDLKLQEVEECEVIVAGEVWHKIAGFINRLI